MILVLLQDSEIRSYFYSYKCHREATIDSQTKERESMAGKRFASDFFSKFHLLEFFIELRSISKVMFARCFSLAIRIASKERKRNKERERKKGS